MGVVRYVVAKYIPDLLRQEPRNVGVIVEGPEGVAARFLGEDEHGRLDLRRVRGKFFNDPQLYAEWHAYWRGLVFTSQAEFIDQLVEESEASFTVWRGGEVHAEGEPHLQAVANDLFERLVEAVPEETNAMAGAADRGLARTIRDEFKRLRILEDRRKGQTLFAEHPVRYRAPVEGTVPVPHRPTFVQENGRRYVMEQINFGSPKQELVRQHSGYVAYMFEDIQEASKRHDQESNVDLIAIVNRAAGCKSEVQEYGLAALHNLPEVRVVNWDDEYQRGKFLQERVEVANVKG